MTQRTRRQISAAQKAKIALEALREQATVTDLAQRYQVPPNRIHTWKKQLQDRAARAFEAGNSGPADHFRRADCGAEFFSAEVRQMSVPDRRAMLDRDHGKLSIRRQCRLLGIA